MTEKHTGSFVHQLPLGTIWDSFNIPGSNAHALATALANPYERLEDETILALRGFNFLSCNSLLSVWEDFLGIPDGIFGGSIEDDTTRANDIFTKLVLMRNNGTQSMQRVLDAYNNVLEFAPTQSDPLHFIELQPTGAAERNAEYTSEYTDEYGGYIDSVTKVIAILQTMAPMPKLIKVITP